MCVCVCVFSSVILIKNRLDGDGGSVKSREVVCVLVVRLVRAKSTESSTNAESTTPNSLCLSRSASLKLCVGV